MHQRENRKLHPKGALHFLRSTSYGALRMTVYKDMPGEARGYWLAGHYFEDAHIHWLVAMLMQQTADPAGSPPRAHRD